MFGVWGFVLQCVWIRDALFMWDATFLSKSEFEIGQENIIGLRVRV